MFGERELLMIPGPTNVSPRVLRALSKPQVSHVGDEFTAEFAETLKLTGKLFMSQGQPFIISGSGTLGMEAAISSVVERGDKVLCVTNGMFGERFVEIAQVYGAEVDVLSFEWGKPIDPERVGERLEAGNYKAFTVEHVDTSTGIANPLEEMGRIARDYESLYIVDTVCGIGGMPLKMDEWGIDLCLTGSQKAIAVPPGLTLLCLNGRAMDKVKNRGKPIEGYYTSLLRWLPIMEDPKRYFATPSTLLILALHESLKMIFEEGLEKRWERHRRIAEAFRNGIEAMDIRLIPQEGYRANTLTVFETPPNLEVPNLLKAIKGYGIIIAGGIGRLKGKSARVGHMGNVCESDIISTLSAIELSLQKLAYPVKPGTALEAAVKALQ